ncbi:uncharacterized protein BYT42DRAFT_587064 [Radiomyces spectabilis]|uniref:uncharacterized protein n=1 Tax=Radiomyces spectabilis TaxID=64574 RepID=UPI002220A036|nr:uncharacterized protein BYT42DRAFT_587064 [Radiomyces spectabilis]KAI8367671.1 hypothetical protein BYT42DRAFT_587064 [Radiomyces spectabilis]
MNAAEGFSSGYRFMPLSIRDYNYSQSRIKMTTILRPEYTSYRQLLRRLAEEYTLLKRDANNLTLLRWIDSNSSFSSPPINNELTWNKCFAFVTPYFAEAKQMILLPVASHQIGTIRSCRILFGSVLNIHFCSICANNEPGGFLFPERGMGVRP